MVTPFLPGDSLLFAAGAVCGIGALNFPAAYVLLATAAFLGNATNYSIGRAIGPRVFLAASGRGWTSRLLNREHLRKAHEFFDRHGGKAVVLSRFLPIFRTFVPFVAGAATMSPPSFLAYNAVGAAGWVALCLGAGFLFGNVPVIKEHFSLVTIGIVLVSLIPMAVEVIRHRLARSRG